MKTSEILIECRSIHADEASWTTAEMARNKNGNKCSWYSPAACQFCALGAVNVVLLRHSLNNRSFDCWDMMRRANEALGNYMGIARGNDEHDHAWTLRMWDKAIEFAKQLEAA